LQVTDTEGIDKNSSEAGRGFGHVEFTMAASTRLGSDGNRPILSSTSKRVERLVPRLSSAGLTPQFLKQVLRAGKMIVKDPASDIEQLSDKRVPQRIPDRQSFFLRRNDILIPQHGQLLRDTRLVERQFLLQFLYRTTTSHKDLQNSNPGGMCQGSEELGLKSL
jgi:hypothetical protein